MTKYINCHTEDKFFSREHSKILSEENVVGKENLFAVSSNITHCARIHHQNSTHVWKEENLPVDSTHLSGYRLKGMTFFFSIFFKGLIF